jgi:hypothetical protein
LQRTTGADPLSDPRVTVRIDDGRHHLLTTDERYDVVTAEPPPPTNAGVVNLYTREYYEAARRVLKRRGRRRASGSRRRAHGRRGLARSPAPSWGSFPDRALLRLQAPVVPRRIRDAAGDRSRRMGARGRGSVRRRGPRRDWRRWGRRLCWPRTWRATHAPKDGGRETLTDDHPRSSIHGGRSAMPPPIPDGLVGSPLAVRELVADPRALEPYRPRACARPPHSTPARVDAASAPGGPPPAPRDDPLAVARRRRSGASGPSSSRSASTTRALRRRTRGSSITPPIPSRTSSLGARAYYDRDFDARGSSCVGVVDAPELEPSACLSARRRRADDWADRRRARRSSNALRRCLGRPRSHRAFARFAAGSRSGSPRRDPSAPRDRSRSVKVALLNPDAFRPLLAVHPIAHGAP